MSLCTSLALQQHFQLNEIKHYFRASSLVSTLILKPSMKNNPFYLKLHRNYIKLWNQLALLNLYVVKQQLRNASNSFSWR